MSLLQNEDFVLYQLRTSYLSNIKDGVGERLININPSVLNNPAFRAAGWNPNPADIKRTYSPPIPTAITSEYFQAPRSAGLPGPGIGSDDEEGGMVTGGGASNDTVGPALNARRRRRKEQLEEDDSSDLSDESDEESESQRAVQQIKFTKMPVRTRAGSSPLRNTTTIDGGPALMITSPSKPGDGRGMRRGSLGALETVKERARRDTVTSSEMSSENELDPSVFQRKPVNPRRAATASAILTERIQEDERESEAQHDEPDPGGLSDSSLDSEFSGTADTGSLLADVAPLDSSSPTALTNIPPPITPHNTSPSKRAKQVQASSTLQALPPPRPISMVQPVSALTQALKAKSKGPEDPFQRFAILSGTGDPHPLYLKIYAPFSTKPNKPFEVILRRKTDDDKFVKVSEAVGFALWRYNEEKLQPPIESDKKNVNKWVLRMWDDGEVDYEFPALTRDKPITDFASNNQRGVRGRAREKPWDEFALVEATEAEFQQNEMESPEYSQDAAAANESSQQETGPNPAAPAPGASTNLDLPAAVPFRNPITGPSFAPVRKDSQPLLDAPAVQTSHSTPRTGAPKTLLIHFTNDDFHSHKLAIDVTTDTYIAEVFDRACRDFAVDKALFVLKVTGTSTVAPLDRTVEALGERSELDLVRRRFVGDGAFGLSASPGSETPNAPLLISTGGTPKKGKKGVVHPLAQRLDPLAHTLNANYKRYAVTRKQPMSFSGSSSRILALDGEYMHIMPSGGGSAHPARNLFEGGGGGGGKADKTTTVHFSSIVGCKVSRRHPRVFRVIVFKERETKRYDFEAQTPAEAKEIVREIELRTEAAGRGMGML